MFQVKALPQIPYFLGSTAIGARAHFIVFNSGHDFIPQTELTKTVNVK